MDLEPERRCRDLVKAGGGSEVIVHRAGPSFTLEIEAKSDDE